MKREEKIMIESAVKFEIMPEIKASIPSMLGWILRAVFPKLEVKIIMLIQRVVEKILEGRNDGSKK